MRQGFRDVSDYQGIFTNEVKEKGIKFNTEEKEKFDDNMVLWKIIIFLHQKKI